MLAAANQIGYTLYTVDVPGFSGPDVDAGSSEAPMEGIAAWREHSLRQTLYRLAGETGGEALLRPHRLGAPAPVAAPTGKGCGCGAAAVSSTSPSTAR